MATLAGNNNSVFNSSATGPVAAISSRSRISFQGSITWIFRDSGISALQTIDPVAPGSVLNPHCLAWIVNGDGVCVFANDGNTPQQIGGAGSLVPDMTHLAALPASDFQLHVGLTKCVAPAEGKST